MPIADKDLYVDSEHTDRRGESIAGQHLVARKGSEIPERYRDASPEISKLFTAVTSGGGVGSLAEPSEPQGEYDAFTVKELRAEVDARGLDVASDAKKSDLIGALEADDSDS